MGAFAEEILLQAPSWFRGRWMSAMLGAVGQTLDDMSLRVYDGRRAAVPYSGQVQAPVVVAAANNGSGLVRLTLDDSRPLLKVKVVQVLGAVTTGGLVLNQEWPISWVDSTHIDLVGSTWTGGYTGSAVISWRGYRQCDPEVLAYHSRDRGVRLYSTEPLLSQRYRLSQWHQLKKARGTHRGELLNVQPFWMSTFASVLPWMRIVHQDNQGSPSAVWWTLSPLGKVSCHRQNTSNWNYSNESAKRSKWWCIIHLPPGYSSAIEYDDGSVFDGGAIYDGVTTLAINDIVAALKEAKSAHSRLGAVISTTLQPTDSIPGHPGRHPFDPTDTAIALADGSTSLPVGFWDATINPFTGLPTRPTWASWLYEDNS